MNQYHIVYGNMKKRTVYYKDRPLDDYHFYDGKVLPKVKVVQYPTFFEGGSSISFTYDSFNHDKLITATERTDNIIFRKDLKISIKRGIKDGVFFDSCYNFVTCLKGYIFLSVTNLMKGTDTYNFSESFILSDENPIQVLIPPFYGFAYQSLEDSIILDKMAYKSEQSLIQEKIDINKLDIEWPWE